MRKALLQIDVECVEPYRHLGDGIRGEKKNKKMIKKLLKKWHRPIYHTYIKSDAYDVMVTEKSTQRM